LLEYKKAYETLSYEAKNKFKQKPSTYRDQVDYTRQSLVATKINERYYSESRETDRESGGIRGETGCGVGGYPVRVATIYLPIIASFSGSSYADSRSRSAGKQSRACWRAGL
jgi:hypothetical protein